MDPSMIVFSKACLLISKKEEYIHILRIHSPNHANIDYITLESIYDIVIKKLNSYTINSPTLAIKCKDVPDHIYNDVIEYIERWEHGNGN